MRLWKGGGGLALVCVLWFAPPVAGRTEAPCATSARWESLIRAHLTRYPEMQVQDLYKLLHQATMGSEHAVSSRLDAEQWLTQELATLGGGPVEPLVDPLGDGGLMARVHLRPFVAQHGRPSALLDGFVATANGHYGNRADLECALDTVRSLGEHGALPWPARMVTDYLATRAAEGYPAVHHSAAFSAAYHPAYRVIAVALLPTALER